MTAEGRVLHRYGGRDATSPTSSLSMPSLIRLLRLGLETHRQLAEEDWEPPPRRTLDDVPAWAEKMAALERQGKPQACYHCHFVYDAAWEQGQQEGTWDPGRIWRHPPPERVGLTLDRREQERIVAVRAGSPAARAGLRVGDRLGVLQGQRVLSHADVRWVLETTPYEGGRLAVSYQRGDKVEQATLELSDGWRVGTPLEFSWRPSKWRLQPRPGFGGRDLRKEERAALGLPGKGFGFKVGYLVTWGPMPRYGRAAERAGVRKGDVVLRVGDAELVDQQHFHAWWRLTRKPGEVVEVEVLRGTERLTLELTVIE